jgi:hypothetical protein
MFLKRRELEGAKRSDQSAATKAQLSRGKII